MKGKILVFILLALGAGFGAGYYFCDKRNGEERRDSDEQTAQRSSTDVEEIQSGDTDVEAKRYGDPITYEEAKLMHDTYRDRWVQGKSYRSRSLWFSYHELADYLKNIDEEIKEDTSNIGIRFYFGAKDKPIQGYRYRLTMFMVPTFGKGPHKRDTISTALKIIGAYNHGDLCPPETTCGTSIFERP